MAQKPIIIANDKGERLMLVGNQWVPVAAGGPGPGAAPKLTNPDRTKLNTLNEQAAQSMETKQTYQRARQAVKQLKPGPFRGRFLEAAIPDEGGGFWDSLGATVVGAPAKLLGAIDDKDVNAYQTLKALQSGQVLDKQILQKGPQTESDAARLQLTEISPLKSAEVNTDVMNRGEALADRVIGRAPFYSQWTAKYGLNGVDQAGRSVEQAYQQDIKRRGAVKSGVKRMRYNPATGEIE